MTRPLLILSGDAKEHRISDVADEVADALELSEADRRETIPSGGKRFINRMSWAVSHMVKAGLLEKPQRGVFRITEKGQQLLKEGPPEITVELFRKRYPEWQAAWNEASAKNKSKPDKPDADETGDSPEERMEAANDEIRSALADEILTAVKDLSPAFFEQLVVRVIVKMGYGGTLRDAGQALGRSGDGGVDGIIKEDRLGLDTIYLQAKRYRDGTVGRPDVQAFVGALQGFRARKGIFITTSSFTRTATEYVDQIETKVVLIDGQALADYMIDFGVGVATVSTYEVKRIDTDFFVED